MDVIQVSGLEKHYEGQVALRGVDWQLAPGEACALLGPNGAGKSTLLKILVGFIRSTGGEARLFGQDPWSHDPELKARVAYVPELPMLPLWPTVGTLLKRHRMAFPRWDAKAAAEVLDRFEISARSKVGALSKGSQQRVRLALALGQGADLMLLDEPGSGLDVGGRRELLSFLSEFLVEEGRTVVLSTHLVTDVERIASRVTVISQGESLANDEIDDLRDEVRIVRLPRETFDRMESQLAAAGILATHATDHEVAVTLRYYGSVARALLAPEIGSEEEERALRLSLEDIFLALTRGAA